MATRKMLWTSVAIVAALSAASLADAQGRGAAPAPAAGAQAPAQGGGGGRGRGGFNNPPFTPAPGSKLNDWLRELSVSVQSLADDRESIIRTCDEFATAPAPDCCTFVPH